MAIYERMSVRGMGGALPTYQQQTAPTAEGSGKSGRVNGTDMARPYLQAADNAAAVARLGAQIGNAVQAGVKAYDDYNLSKATRLMTEYRKTIREKLSGENGILTRKGENALGGVDELDNTQRQTRLTLLEGASDLTRKHFERLVESFDADNKINVAHHKETEQRNVMNANDLAAAEDFGDEAMLNIANPERFSAAAGKGLFYLEQQWKRNGVGEEAQARGKKEYLSKLYKNGIASLLASGDLGSAQSALARAGVESMTAGDYAQARQAIQTKVEAAAAKAEAARLRAEREAERAEAKKERETAKRVGALVGGNAQNAYAYQVMAMGNREQADAAVAELRTMGQTEEADALAKNIDLWEYSRDTVKLGGQATLAAEGTFKDELNTRIDDAAQSGDVATHKQLVRVRDSLQNTFDVKRKEAELVQRSIDKEAGALVSTQNLNNVMYLSANGNKEEGAKVAARLRQLGKEDEAKRVEQYVALGEQSADTIAEAKSLKLSEVGNVVADLGEARKKAVAEGRSDVVRILDGQAEMVQRVAAQRADAYRKDAALAADAERERKEGETIADVFASRAAVQKANGVQVQLLPKASLDEMAANINNGTMKPDDVRGLLAAAGENKGALMEQLRKGKVLSDTMQTALMFDGDKAEHFQQANVKGYANNTITALNLQSSDVNVLKSDVALQLKPIMQTLVMQGGSAKAANMQEAVFNAAVGYLAKGYGEGKAVELATKDILDKYTFRDTYRIPNARGIDAKAVTRGASSLLKDDKFLESVDWSTVKTLGGKGNKEIKNYVINSGKWVTNADETGLVLTVNGVRLKKNDGTDVMIPFTDLQKVEAQRAAVVPVRGSVVGR